ncbi:MAG: exonuclease domain-containing protein [Pseudomonadota bacterium]
MNHSPWILLDIETTGFKAPIYVVELAAQRMRGWSPEGLPFHRLLNHNTDIPPEASRVNGYTREIIERDGEPPLKGYNAFADYVDGQPLVAYHLRYDLDNVLRPEWELLGIEHIGRPGFCALRLAQLCWTRCRPAITSCKPCVSITDYRNVARIPCSGMWRRSSI